MDFFKKRLIIHGSYNYTIWPAFMFYKAIMFTMNQFNAESPIFLHRWKKCVYNFLTLNFRALFLLSICDGMYGSIAAALNLPILLLPPSLIGPAHSSMYPTLPHPASRVGGSHGNCHQACLVTAVVSCRIQGERGRRRLCATLGSTWKHF